MSDVLLWTDLETFGLDREADPILELGIHITDLELNTIAEQYWLVWENGISDAAYKRVSLEASQYIFNMHTQNGLFDEARAMGMSPIEVEKRAIEWLQNQGIEPGKEPVCGSSVRFDREMLGSQMWKLNDFFHYRIIDTSSIKELCRRYNKRVYEHLPPKTEQHRVEPDLNETIEEFEFYRDNFLYWAPVYE